MSSTLLSVSQFSYQNYTKFVKLNISGTQQRKKRAKSTNGIPAELELTPIAVIIYIVAGRLKDRNTTRVHTSRHTDTHEYIRIHTSNKREHTSNLRVRTSNIRLTYEYIRVTYICTTFVREAFSAM